jgi:hypothetical protein
MKNSFVSRWFWRASAGALVLGAWALAGAAQAQDFYDDFTDPGFTQSAWTAVDPRSVVFQQPTGSWGVGNGWYEVFAVPTPTDLIPTVGGARMGSIINNFIGADFYGMFTLEGFDPVQGQFMGLGARLTTVDLGMTSGYVFG